MNETKSIDQKTQSSNYDMIFLDKIMSKYK